MRLLKIGIDSFQCIETANVELGPGLNVLYGPNDHGKSSLASAVRAALLLQHTSSAGDRLASWHSSSPPSVRLTFATEDRRFWRVHKVFGKSGSSSLEFSSDGTSYASDASARQVDDRLRDLLRWGVPKTGEGKVHGFPDTFLGNVLLAPQGDVPRILELGLAQKEESAREFLGEALAALAQDPAFKRVLDVAVARVGKSITSTGKITRVKGSSLQLASADVADLRKQQEELQARIDETRTALDTVADLQDRLDILRTQQGYRQAELERAATAVLQAQQRAECEGKLLAARGQLAELEAKRQELTDLDARLASLEQALALLVNQEKVAQTQLEAAGAALREATSEQGAQQLAIRRAQLENDLLQAQQQLSGLERGVQAAEEAARALAALADLRAQAATCRSLSVSAEQELAAADAAQDNLLQLERFAELEAVRRQLAQALEAAQRAEQQEAQADALESEAEELEQTLEDSQLPDPSVLAALTRLEKDLEVAQARLGGGMSVAVRARPGVSFQASSDGREALPLSGDQMLEAQRTFQLKVDDLVEVTITAGEASARENLQRLTGRWTAEAVPVLTANAVAGIDALTQACRRAEQTARQIKELASQAANCRRMAEQSARGGQDVTALQARVAEREGAYAGMADQLAALGPSWEPELKRRMTTAAHTRQQQDNTLQDLRRELAGLEARIGADEPSCLRLREAAGGLELDPARLQLVGLRAREAELKGQLEALVSQAGTAQEEARQAVASAQALLASASQQRLEADKRLQDGRIERAEAQGVLGLRETQAGNLAEQLAGLEREWAALPPTGPPVNLTAAEEAVRRILLEIADQEKQLNMAQGALSKVGGSVVAERKADLDVAVERAEAYEHEIEVDIRAWKLLLDTLREVENTEGAHLGRALSAPVGERMRELCEGRYGAVSIASDLKVETLDVAGQGRAFRDLSEGTKDQLATLFRICLAEQLSSSVILDDHLNQSDPIRVRWFVQLLRAMGEKIQVVLITCRPDDYLGLDERPGPGESVRDVGERLRCVDLGLAIARYGGDR